MNNTDYYISLKALDDTEVELKSLMACLFEICSILRRRIAAAAVHAELGVASSANVQGEQQKQLDIIANDLFVEALLAHPAVAGLASEEMEDPLWASHESGKYLVVFDPLDGSSNIDVNVSVGAIFSVLLANGKKDHEAFLQAGSQQVAAGYALYGPNTQIVFTVGDGTHGLSLDPNTERFVPMDEVFKIPPQAEEYAINSSNRRHWLAPVKRYIEECEAGVEGPRERNFNMRWVASMVAEIHRIFVRGGVFLYPEDTREPSRAGKLRLLYEANPMAFLVEQAQGDASNGSLRLLSIEPSELHQRVAVVMGAAEEVKRIAEYHHGG